jgi:hypothetical protein
MLVAISVDYAATGTGHMDRAPSRICLAREGGVVFDSLVMVPNLFDAMEVYTDITTETLRCATDTAEDVKSAVHALLSPDDVIVGTSMHRTTRVLGLVHGVHFSRVVDLVERTRTWNARFGHWNYYSLPKIAHVCGVDAPSTARARAECAILVHDMLVVDSDAARVRSQLQSKQYARQFPPVITAKPETSVCTHAYNVDLCFCGQPTLSDHRAKVAQARTEAS